MFTGGTGTNWTGGQGGIPIIIQNGGIRPQMSRDELEDLLVTIVVAESVAMAQIAFVLIILKLLHLV